MNKPVQSVDFYRTYPIVSAVRTQLDRLIPEESNNYNRDAMVGNATLPGSYTHLVLSGYKHIIPLGLGKKKELGGVKYE